MSDYDEATLLFRGLLFGALFAIPIWVGVFLLTTWLIAR
jgi:hypothetical protein